MNISLPRPRRRIATLAILAAAVATLVAFGATPGPVPAAQAASCPSMPSGTPLGSWSQKYNAKGVLVCQALQKDNSDIQADLQIVDLSAGAKVRVISRVASGQTPGTPGTKFEKRNAPAWDTWIRANATSIPPSRLFSVVNASFFVNVNPAIATTELSLPEMTGSSIRSQGFALAHHTDAAWNRAKTSVAFSSPTTAGTQAVFAQNFPTNYTPTNINQAFLPFYDGLVAFAPLAGDTVSSDRRTALGYASSTHQLFILSSESHLTLGQASAILTFAGSDFNIQLDGGGSGQLYSRTMDNAGLDVGWTGREVPDVLAVWQAP